MKKWNLIVNVGRCENCYNCVISTRDEYTGNDFPGYTAPAAAAGEAPIRIMRRVQGAEPMVEAMGNRFRREEPGISTEGGSTHAMARAG